MGLQAQLIEGHTEPTTCSRDFRPPTLTFHEGYAWNVTFYTFPYQFGHARYSALPSPAISVDGSATWTDPGAYVECTITWYYNSYGRVESVKYNWHISSYTGTVTANGGCDGEGGEWTDPIYTTSYDPYLADQAIEDLTVQDCDGGGGGNPGGETLTCWWEWMEIEISYDGGKTWHPFWSGLGQVCEQQAA
jgi:hypothetical protein